MKVVSSATNEEGCMWTQNTVTPHQFYAVPGNKMGKLTFPLSDVESEATDLSLTCSAWEHLRLPFFPTSQNFIIFKLHAWFCILNTLFVMPCFIRRRCGTFLACWSCKWLYMRGKYYIMLDSFIARHKCTSLCWIILSLISVINDGFRICNWIYWPLTGRNYGYYDTVHDFHTRKSLQFMSTSLNWFTKSFTKSHTPNITELRHT
jgi:hypothetical protein